ncbi:hypothetical protein HJC23_010520 [Cyclotella cryptica]|uniref:Calcineurin-like phosphoesterase domain-containing protein n=1 Tax=Cyclotella cryptica TaxID=29204 RepID=A0ABD3QAG6_9STRA|eukprot:CCRYP_007105-RA/>CCRYP_007105-RA protein AED:0.16 eAED:0.16 QI:335/1/1/1/0/0/3/3015/787
MNSRPSADEETPSTRHSARSRYSISTAPYDFGNNDMARLATAANQTIQKAKGGINGRDFDDDEIDGDASSIKRNRSGGSGNGTKSSLDELEREFAVARSGSQRSSRDRPWKTASSGGDALEGGSPGNNHNYNTRPDLSYGTNPSRWAPDSDYVMQSRQATSNAVVEMATKLADRAAEEFDDASFAPPMGGAAGTGLGDREYVKGRLSSLLLSPEGRDSTRSGGNSGRLIHSAPAKVGNDDDVVGADEESEYDKVRNQAMKMLRIADSLDSNGVVNHSSTSLRDHDNKVTGLFRTSTGGLSMRQLENDEVSFLKKKRHSAIAGLERFTNTKECSTPKVDFIGSNDEEDPFSQQSANDEYADTPDTSRSSSRSSSWSSRYSVERQLMAITGGLDSTHILNKMDVLHSHREKTKSARGMYRSSAAAMDGSGEEYGDYTKEYSTTAGGLGGVWRYIHGTLWSDLMEVNYDGTTQSLVRREKRRIKRRRVVMGLVGFLALVIAVSVLVVKGNPRSTVARGNSAAGATIHFYVLADEPYDLSNARQLTNELENLPSDAEFLVHLGNANGGSESACQEYGYERAANVLKESPVPTLVIPGDKDWVTCDQPSRALSWWSQNLGMFDKRFEDSKKLNVVHQNGREENFAFLYKGVLFLSAHIVDAATNPTEWTSRHEQNVMWTKEQLNQDGYRAVVIFGHAPPSSKQGEYFWPVIGQLKDTNIPVLYLHANTQGGDFDEYHPFGEADNFIAVQLEKRGREAPMEVTVWGDGKHQNDMFEFTRRNITNTKGGYDASQ